MSMGEEEKKSDGALSDMDLNVYEAAVINKYLAAKGIRVEPSEIVWKWSTNPKWSKKKQKPPRQPPLYFPGDPIGSPDQEPSQTSLNRRVSNWDWKPNRI